MIPSGLKVGDTYEYYGFTYEVTRVIGDMYESKRVRVSAPSAPVEPKAEEVKPDYESMAYAELKKLCAKKNIDARGTKADLIARLEG